MSRIARLSVKMTPMGCFSISSLGVNAIEVRAPNWIAALGLGLEELGRADSINRLACEVLPNGTVIARDIQSGTGYVVQGVEEPDETEIPVVELDDLDIEPLTDEEAVEFDLERRLGEIRSADSVSGAASLALTLVRELVPAESGAVILKEKGYLRFISVVGPHARRLMGVRLPLGTGVAGFAMMKKRTVVLDEAHEDPRHCGAVDGLTGYVTKQIAVVPVLSDGACVGVVELMNLPNGERFENQKIESLRQVADALGDRLASET